MGLKNSLLKTKLSGLSIKQRQKTVSDKTPDNRIKLNKFKPVFSKNNINNVSIKVTKEPIIAPSMDSVFVSGNRFLPNVSEIKVVKNTPIIMETQTTSTK